MTTPWLNLIFLRLIESTDLTVTLNRLASYRAYDPDFNNTGMNIVASGPIAVVWGEASLNQAGAACASYQPKYGPWVYGCSDH